MQRDGANDGAAMSASERAAAVSAPASGAPCAAVANGNGGTPATASGAGIKHQVVSKHSNNAACNNANNAPASNNNAPPAPRGGNNGAAPPSNGTNSNGHFKTSSHPSLAALAPNQSHQPSAAAKVRHNATLTTAMMNNPPHLSPADAVHCSTCGFAGSDLRIKGCPRGCAYHARCIDLVGLCNAAHQRQQGPRSNNDNIVISSCPGCGGTANGLEIVPLSFAELDRSQRVGLGKKGMLSGSASNTSMTSALGSSSSEGMKSSTGEMSRKRSSNDLGAAGGTAASYPSNVNLACRAANVGSAGAAGGPSSYGAGGGTLSGSQCYDPAVPRTGRWTDEELAFRDAIIAHFLDGALPLSNGLKLNDFLSNMLKSKQSRLTKKMKHAKLSTKYFRIKSGYLSPASRAKELSSLEHNFVSVVADPVERSEIAFHMQKEWRDHLAERCTYLRIQFDADAWLRSVDAMDRRVALEKNRSRMVKRRCLMGKAMEKDVSEHVPGVFIDQVEDRRTEDFLHDMEAKSRQVRTPSLGGDFGGNAGGGGGENKNQEEEDGDFGRFLMSMLDEAPIAMNHALAGGGVGHPSQAQAGGHPAPGPKKAAVRSSYCDPNFRYAAPFLAGITSYMERNGVPFEHVDIWVPSTVPLALEGEGQGSMGSAPMIGEMGSGGSQTNLTRMEEDGDGKGGVCRLCFAGSATLGVQIVDEPLALVDGTPKSGSERKGVAARIAPLSGDEIFNFSLYGDYSEKFSFSTGCGLPGRVFQSGVAAWEQFLANAPPEMFERRGGAMQFGIRTALGLPIDSPNVGRIVLVLYSKHNREKDEELVNRVVKDVRLFNPCPRWKLVVDVSASSGGNGGVQASPVAAQPPAPSPPPPPPAAVGMAGSTSFSAGMSALSMQPAAAAQLGMDLAGETATSHKLQNHNEGKNNQIIGLISLLQENMPSDQSSPLGKQLNSIMSLRMILLRPNRSAEEEQLVETILVLYESYIAAGRTRPDIALLVTRDYDFHTQHQQQHVALMAGPGPMSTMRGQQQGLPLQQQQHMLQHNFSQPGPLGGRPGSFLPAPLAPPLQPFGGGVGGGQIPMLQNVVHPYPSAAGHAGGGMPRSMQMPMPPSMLINAHPSNCSIPPSKGPSNEVGKS